MITQQQQIQQFIDYCEAHLDFTEPDPNGYQSAPLCALDSLFSGNARYGAVVNMMERMKVFLGVQDITMATTTTSEMIALIIDTPDDDLAANLMTKNKVSYSGQKILKVTAYKMLLKVLQVCGVETRENIWENAENRILKEKMMKVPGIGMVLLDYFFILSGMKNYVKDDVHIQRFINNAISMNAFTHNDRVDLIRKTAHIMSTSNHSGMTPRHLDHIIWIYQSNRK